jgi:plastocyanin
VRQRSVRKSVLGAVVPVAAVLAAAVACGGGSSSGPGTTAQTPTGSAEHPTKLIGDVGHDDAFTITFKDQDGKDLSRIAAGTYPVEIDDESTIHNFHLSGGGVDKLTGVGSTGKQTFSITLKPGTYSFQCDPHAGQMHGSFTVT